MRRIVVGSLVVVFAVVVALAITWLTYRGPSPADVATAPPETVLPTPDPVVATPPPDVSEDSAGEDFGPALPPSDARERQLRQAAFETGDPDILGMYIREFPDSPYRAQAEALLARDEPAPSQPAGATPDESATQVAAISPDQPAPVIVVNPASADMRDFPWPPPVPSAQFVVPRALFKAPEAPVPLTAVGNRLATALQRSRYEYSFYRAPGGFALVARLERIADDGTPINDDTRFLPPDAEAPFSFSGYIEQLFFAPEGYYRMIIFVVTDRSFAAIGAPLTAEDTTALLQGGALTLPNEFAAAEFTDAHIVVALVYEFRKGSSQGDVATLYPGRLSGETHLQRAGLSGALESGG